MIRANGQPNLSLTILVSVAALVLTLFGMYWSLADPRSELKDIRTSYLSLREHEEFVNRVSKDLARLESGTHIIEEKFQTLLNARQSKEAADQATIRVEQRITGIAEDLRELSRNTIQQKQLDDRILLLQKQLDTLERAATSHSVVQK